MKKNLLSLAIIGSIAFLTSCGGSDSTDPHIVGDWEIESFVYVNMPPGFSRSEGIQNTPNYFEISSFIWELKSGGEFVEKLTPLQGVSRNSTGTWVATDEELTLTFIDGDDEVEVVHDIEKNDTDQLWVIGQEYQDILIADATQDSIINHHGSQEAANVWLSSWFSTYDPNVPAHVDTAEMIFDVVTFDLMYAFARKN